MSGIRLSATRVLTALDTTKLDTIETSADVTDATNVEAAATTAPTVSRVPKAKTADGSPAASKLDPTWLPAVVGTGAGETPGVMIAADKTKLDGIEIGADVTDSGNVTTAGAVMRSVITTIGDLITASSVGPVVTDRIAGGAAGTVLVGNGAGVKPSFQAVAGLAVDVLDAVVAVADSASGVATTTGTVQINTLAGAPIAHAVVGLLLAQTAQYGGRNAIEAGVTYSLATAGSILASGAGWCVFKTDATGLFACTLTDAADEVVWFSVTGADGGHDALAAGAIIRGCVPDRAEWIV